MTARSTFFLESEASLLKRMEASRAQLLIAQCAVKRHEAERKPSFLDTATRLPALVSTAPTVSLVIAVIVGCLIVGPKKIATVVVRNGLVAWIAKTVRRLAGR